jgi:hypothetical protein
LVAFVSVWSHCSLRILNNSPSTTLNLLANLQFYVCNQINYQLNKDIHMKMVLTWLKRVPRSRRGSRLGEWMLPPHQPRMKES